MDEQNINYPFIQIKINRQDASQKNDNEYEQFQQKLAGYQNEIEKMQKNTKKGDLIEQLKCEFNEQIIKKQIEIDSLKQKISELKEIYTDEKDFIMKMLEESENKYFKLYKQMQQGNSFGNIQQNPQQNNNNNLSNINDLSNNVLKEKKENLEQQQSSAESLIVIQENGYLKQQIESLNKKIQNYYNQIQKEKQKYLELAQQYKKDNEEYEEVMQFKELVVDRQKDEQKKLNLTPIQRFIKIVKRIQLFKRFKLKKQTVFLKSTSIEPKDNQIVNKNKNNITNNLSNSEMKSPLKNNTFQYQQSLNLSQNSKEDLRTKSQTLQYSPRIFLIKGSSNLNNEVMNKTQEQIFFQEIVDIRVQLQDILLILVKKSQDNNSKVFNEDSQFQQQIQMLIGELIEKMQQQIQLSETKNKILKSFIQTSQEQINMAKNQQGDPYLQNLNEEYNKLNKIYQKKIENYDINFNQIHKFIIEIKEKYQMILTSLNQVQEQLIKQKNLEQTANNNNNSEKNIFNMENQINQFKNYFSQNQQAILESLTEQCLLLMTKLEDEKEINQEEKSIFFERILSLESINEKLAKSYTEQINYNLSIIYSKEFQEQLRSQIEFQILKCSNLVTKSQINNNKETNINNNNKEQVGNTLYQIQVSNNV